MVKTLIIENELETRKGLIRMLKLIHADLEIVGETSSVKESVAFLQNNTVDLALVDIELSDDNSFQIFKQLDNIDFKVIFITAFNQYAINAFKVNALDYLLKPVDPEELLEAINKAKKSVYDTQQLKQLAQVVNQQEHQKITLKTTQQTYFITVSDILYIEAEGAYTKFITKNQNILVSKNLRYYESLFEQFHFIRTHNSFIVNVKHVEKIKSNTLILSNHSEIPISTRKKPIVLQQLKK